MKRILIVDDEPGILEVLKTLLETEDREIVSANSGEEAKSNLSAGEFNLMITDIRMQPISGMELLHIAREMKPDMAVIMLTAYGTVDTAVEAMQLGAFDYVHKPFKAAELLAIVQRALEFQDLALNSENSRDSSV